MKGELKKLTEGGRGQKEQMVLGWLAEESSDQVYGEEARLWWWRAWRWRGVLPQERGGAVYFLFLWRMIEGVVLLPGHLELTLHKLTGGVCLTGFGTRVVLSQKHLASSI